MALDESSGDVGNAVAWFQDNAPRQIVAALLAPLFQNFEANQITPLTKRPAAGYSAKRAAARHDATKAIQKAELRVFNWGPDSIMPDGRRLGAWTVGELRRAGTMFDHLVSLVKDQRAERTLDSVLTALDWQRIPRPT